MTVRDAEQKISMVGQINETIGKLQQIAANYSKFQAGYLIINIITI